MFILCVHLTMHLSVIDITTLEMIIKPKIFMGLFLLLAKYKMQHTNKLQEVPSCCVSVVSL